MLSELKFFFLLCPENVYNFIKHCILCLHLLVGHHEYRCFLQLDEKDLRCDDHVLCIPTITQSDKSDLFGDWDRDVFLERSSRDFTMLQTQWLIITHQQ